MVMALAPTTAAADDEEEEIEEDDDENNDDLRELIMDENSYQTFVTYEIKA